MARILIQKNGEHKVVPDSEYQDTYRKQGWTISTKTTPPLTTSQVPTDVWMQDSPFTKEENEAYNRYTHFPADINKRFKETVLANELTIKNKLAEYGVDKLTDKLNTAVYYYRRAVYRYFLEEIRARTMAPPAYVVGPSKYPTHRLPKAEKIREKSLYPIKLAEKYTDKGIREAIKGKPLIAIITKWLPHVKSAKSRLAFGKWYVDEKKREIKSKSESELTGYDHMLLSGTFDHVLRSEGRAIFDQLTHYITLQPKKQAPEVMKKEETDEEHFIDMVSPQQKALVEGWKNKGYVFWSWGHVYVKIGDYYDRLKKAGYDPYDHHVMTVTDTARNMWKLFYVRPMKAKLPAFQPTLTGEAALLAQRIKKPETPDKKPAKKKYVEPEPYQMQIGGGFQTALCIVGGLSLFYLLKKRMNAQWME